MSKDNPIHNLIKEFISSSNTFDDADYADKVEKIKKSPGGMWIEFSPRIEGLHIQSALFEGCLLVPPEAAVDLAKELIANAEKVLKLRQQHPMSPKTH